MIDPTQAVADRAARVAAIEDRVAVLAAEMNRIQAELVDLVAVVEAEGIAADEGLTPQRWLAWRAGMTTARAAAVAVVAARREELPTAIELLREGRLTIDQAAAVARHVPAAFEAEGTELARKLPVGAAVYHLSRTGWTLPEPADAPAVEERASSHVDDHGTWRMSAALDPDHGAVVDTALRAARDELYQARKAEAPDGERPLVSTADALVCLAETYLRVRGTAAPGTDRFRVHLHHEVGSSGGAATTVHGSATLPSGLARLHTCDGSMRSILEVGGRAVGICKAARIVPEWLRRLVEHRDAGRCRVPGCGNQRDLQMHHIWHWEDRGPTESWNLLTICGRHHRTHHKDLLGIVGNADLPDDHPDGLRFTNRYGLPLHPNPAMLPPPGGPPCCGEAESDPPAYPAPYRERLDPWAVCFNTPPPRRPAPPNPHAARPDG